VASPAGRETTRLHRPERAPDSRVVSVRDDGQDPMWSAGMEPNRPAW
jgi:hypothetical protein